MSCVHLVNGTCGVVNEAAGKVVTRPGRSQELACKRCMGAGVNGYTSDGKPTQILMDLCRSYGGVPGELLERPEGVGDILKRKIAERFDCPSCPACDRTLASMNAFGPEGCRKRLVEIVAGMVPRAIKCGLRDMTWAERWKAVKAAWSAGGIAAAIESVVIDAIEEAEAAERRVPFVESAGSVRNLAMHVLPIAGNGVWQWHVAQIAKRANLFNGQKVLGVSEIRTPTTLSMRPDGVTFQTEPVASVVNLFREHGIEFDAVVVAENNELLREGELLPAMLAELESTDERDATFVCHAKNAARSLDHIGIEWAEAMYTLNLDHWPTTQAALRQHAMAGAFKRYGAFAFEGNHRWHYSGSYCWFRHDQVFNRDWRTLDQHFASVESWPGRLFLAKQTACLLLDNADDMYELPHWENTVRPALQEWKSARGL